VVLLSMQWGHVTEYPETIDSFVEFVKQCEDETSEVGRGEYFYDAMEVLREALGEEACEAKTLVKYSATGMHHYRFDKAPELPDNYAIVGDALLRLNPIFGQGCAKAAQDVTTLDAMLRKVTGPVVPNGFSKQVLSLQTPRARVFFDSTRMMGESKIHWRLL
jgi:2-polyprenyl-6-methoxyphenol hydroxylase-like FAD-dependent oxidoreductase